mgnify:CR=1 FL=1
MGVRGTAVPVLYLRLHAQRAHSVRATRCMRKPGRKRVPWSQKLVTATPGTKKSLIPDVWLYVRCVGPRHVRTVPYPYSEQNW